MSDRQNSSLMTTDEASAWLRLKTHTLENMRWQGTGPKFLKHGGRVFYDRRDIEVWSEASRRQSSSGTKA